MKEPSRYPGAPGSDLLDYRIAKLSQRIDLLRRVAGAWESHNLILGAKDQVVAQFGRDSNEAQAVGLKKKSEYKARTRPKTSNVANDRLANSRPRTVNGKRERNGSTLC